MSCSGGTTVEDYLVILIIGIFWLGSVAVLIPIFLNRAKKSPFLAYVLIALSAEAVMFVITAFLQISGNQYYYPLENLALIPVNATYFFLYLYFESLSTVQAPHGSYSSRFLLAW